MPQAGTFGIGFDELLYVAIAITVVLAVVPVINDSRGLNPLNFPGSFIASFNNLWFDNFNFLQDKRSDSCVSLINATGSVMVQRALTNATIETENVTKSNDALGYLLEHAHFEYVFGSQIGGIVQTVKDTGLNKIPFSVEIGGAGQSAVYTAQYVFDACLAVSFLIIQILISCTLSGVRLIIGVFVFGWLFYKALPVLDLLFKVFMALIG